MSDDLISSMENSNAFFAGLGIDSDHFSSMWHIIKVSQFLSVDVDNVAREHGLSGADVYLLAALRNDRSRPLHAADLAITLEVSNAVLSSRTGKLAALGMLDRQPSALDRRAFDLTLTAKGAATVEKILADFEIASSFIAHFRSLPEKDRADVARIMGHLHRKIEREFIASRRGSH